jgi:hypothetical protein
MKPEVIGTIEDFQCPQIDWESMVEPGEVESRTSTPDEWSFPQLVNVAVTAGYAPCHAWGGYASVSFLSVNGSVKWHTDPGSGINVACLVSHETNLYAKPELITRHGAMEISTGEVFVFDSNKGHAWISQEVCVLASITVRRRRKSKTSRP